MSDDVRAVLSGERRWAVVCGERDDVLASLDDGAVDVTLTDPPYDAHTHANVKTTRGNWKKGGREGRGDVSDIDLAFTSIDAIEIDRVAPQLVKVTKRWVVAFAALEQLGDWKRAVADAWIRSGVWDRVLPTPQLSGDRPAQRVEGVAIMHRPGRKHWNGGGGFAFWSHMRLAHHHVRHGHPTEKPVPLMRELVRLFSDPGEVIADWHAGSGTTGVAALMEGRRIILVERDPVHTETCRRRCEETVGGVGTRRAKQIPLFGGRP